MLIDAENTYSDAQALTATAASTNIIDHASDRNLGIGEPLSVLITLDVASDNTTGNETYTATLETDDNSAFSSATAVGEIITIVAGAAAGTRYVIAVPADTRFERYSRLNFTLGGTTPTVTVTAQLMQTKLLEPTYVAYPKGYTIS